MINWFWFILMAAGIIFAAINGETELLNQSLFAAAENTPMLILELCGMICLWTGLMKIAEKSGLVALLGRLLAPVIRLLFPDLPKKSPAYFPILMNVSANLLGIGNAATPFGLKAMEELQKVNRDKTRASPAMVTFLVMNTSCITLFPTMVLSLRVAAGSTEPTATVAATVIASSAGLCFALILDRLIRFVYYRR
jgi:spore maturation protein A